MMEEDLRGLGRIISTTDPLQALDLAAVYQPKVTILDIEMPTLNGLSLCKQLLENPDTANTAVIFITSHNETDMEYQPFEYGAVDFIAKPTDMRLCRLRVLNQLQLRIQSDALSVAKGDLQDLLSQLPIFVSYWSPQWERRFCNDYSKNWFGLGTDKELDREASIDMILQEALALRIRKEVYCQHDQNNLVFRYELNTYVAGSKHLDIHVKRRITDGKLIGYIVTAIDMTNIVNTQLALTEEKEWLNVTLNSIGNDVITTDLQLAINHPFYINGTAHRITASIGISIYPDDADNEEKLLRYADTAMYRAKKQGKQQHCFFSQDLESELLHRHHVEIQLRQAIERNALGVSISIDDFGTSYSSLSYLKAFPIDELKIDWAFVSDMTKDEQSFNVVKTVVHLAKSLGLTLVAEGIETEQEETLLCEPECECGQGFLFSRPVTYDALRTLVENVNYVKV